MKLRPKILEMKPGTRIVANTFTMEDWQADQTETVTGDCVSWCTALLWIVPAKAEGTWQLGNETLTLKQSNTKTEAKQEKNDRRPHHRRCGRETPISVRQWPRHRFAAFRAATSAVLASASPGRKHFAGYGAALGGRDNHEVDLSDNELWNTYLPPFKAAIDAGAGNIMSAYMGLNGVPATGNPWPLTDVLRKQWGFKGFVVTDAGAAHDLLTHEFAGQRG